MRPLYGVGEHNTRIFFLLLNSDMVLSDLTPDNFPKILQIKWNEIRSMKFEKVQIHFLSDVFVLLSSRKFFYDGNVT